MRRSDFQLDQDGMGKCASVTKYKESEGKGPVGWGFRARRGGKCLSIIIKATNATIRALGFLSGE